jgi:hypothetical protein
MKPHRQATALTESQYLRVWQNSRFDQTYSADGQAQTLQSYATELTDWRM